MKITCCVICGKALTNSFNVGPVCKTKAFKGANINEAKRLKPHLNKAIRKGKTLGVHTIEDLENKTVSCVVLHKYCDELDQQVVIDDIKNKFFTYLYHTLEPAEQKQLCSDLYGDKVELGQPKT